MFDYKEVNETQLFTDNEWKTCQAGFKLNMDMSEEELRKLTNATNTLKTRLDLYKIVRTKGKEPAYESSLLNAVMEAVEYIGKGKWRELK